MTLPCKITEHPAKYEKLPELLDASALVVDDDENTRLSLCSMLREMGLRPEQVNCGKEAVVRAKEAFERGTEYKIYIIDRLISDIAGIEKLRRIHKEIGASEPIVILTAYD
ncbi:MAG: response regulator, partial [Firmicutes bacterium]|nr:response regulator [Bacillota bacterium]